MFEKFRRRSYQLEHLDKGDYSREEYEGCIVELQLVNQWLGDASTLKKTLLREIDRRALETFSLLDVGAGSGELLRVVAQWTRQTKRRARLAGVELNERSSKAIIENSREFPEIAAVQGDALQLPFRDQEFDYVICSLFTHHFVDGQIIDILREMNRVAIRKIFVIDLHRHPIAYYFYTTIGKLFLHNRLIREDGALSILRSFKREELFSLARDAGLHDVNVMSFFPYRLVLTASARGADRQEVGPGANAAFGERAA